MSYFRDIVFLILTMKYIIAPYLEVISDNENFYLKSIYRPNNNYIINNSIYSFLKIFEKPMLVDESFKEFSTIFSHLPKENLHEIFTSFFDENLKSKILLSEDDLLNLILPESEYTCEIGDYINDYKITKKIKNSIPVEIYIVEKDFNLFFIKYISLKKIKDNDIFNDYRIKLLREYETLCKLNQNFTNKPIDFFDGVNYFYISMEFIEGISLKEYILKEENLEKRKKIVTEILEHYSKLHSEGILHGDIHYGNIIVDINHQIKLVDFEFSNVLNKKSNAGQPFFMPPERISENFKQKYVNTNTFQSEVYQIGLLIYYIVFQKLPFESKDWKSLVFEKTNFKYHSNSFLSTTLDSIITKCLEKDPSKRFQNADKILEYIK